MTKLYISKGEFLCGLRYFISAKKATWLWSINQSGAG